MDSFKYIDETLKRYVLCLIQKILSDFYMAYTFTDKEKTSWSFVPRDLECDERDIMRMIENIHSMAPIYEYVKDGEGKEDRLTWRQYYYEQVKKSYDIWKSHTVAEERKTLILNITDPLWHTNFQIKVEDYFARDLDDLLSAVDKISWDAYLRKLDQERKEAKEKKEKRKHLKSV